MSQVLMRSTLVVRMSTNVVTSFGTCARQSLVHVRFLHLVLIYLASHAAGRVVVVSTLARRWLSFASEPA